MAEPQDFGSPKTSEVYRRLEFEAQENVFQNGAAGLELFVREVQGGQQAQDRAVGTVDEQAALEALVDDGGPFDGQLDADHSTLDADILDQGAALAQGLEAAAEGIADDEGAL